MREADGSTRSRRIWWCFVSYVILLALLTLAPPPVSQTNGNYGTNIVPVIYSLKCFVPNPGQPSTTAFCLRIFTGNVALFVPFGMLVPLVAPKTHSLLRIVASAFAVAVSIELLQYAGRWVGSARWTDVDDVLLNVAGALIGYGLLRVGQYLLQPDDS